MVDGTHRSEAASRKSHAEKAERNGDSANASRSQKTPPQRKSASADPTPHSSSSKKRRKVNHACIYCRRSHMTCDLERPCTRCIKRNIGHLCHDEPREPAKKTKQDPDVPKMEPNGANTVIDPAMGPLHRPNGGGLTISLPQEHITSTANLVQPTPVHTSHPSLLGANNNIGMLNIQDWMYNPHAQLAANMHTLHPSYMFSTSEVSNEYSVLNNFLSDTLWDDPMVGTEEQGMSGVTAQFNNSSLGAGNALFATGQQTSQMLPPAVIAKDIIRPPSGLPIDKAKQELFTLTAADPAGTEPPEQRLKKLLQAKYDAGLLRPFNYVKGYDRMYKYIKTNLRRESMIVISRQIEAFRPIFRERVAGLQDIELVYVEIEFEKLLMKYDRIFASMAIPACCWRRTGEIYRGNKEMAELTNLPMESMRDGKTAIHDIFAEKGLVKYWKEFGKIAFVESQKAMISSVILKRTRPDGKYEEVECCFSFTIQRDKHTIPFLIIGNFLQIIPPGT